MVLSQSLRYLWRIFLAAWEATQQRPSSHKSEYLLHVNGLYFYTNTAFRAHQVSESDTETTSFWNRFRVVYGRIHTNPDWKICGFKSVRIPVVEVKVLRWCDKRWFETWCYTGRFATTIFSSTQRCNVAIIRNDVATLCCAKNRGCESSSCNIIFIRKGSARRPTPFLYTIFDQKGTAFVYLPLKNFTL